MSEANVMQADEIAAKLTREGEQYSWDIEDKQGKRTIDIYIRQMDAEDEFVVNNFIASQYQYYTEEEGMDDKTATNMAAADGLTYIIFRTCRTVASTDKRHFKKMVEVRELSFASRYTYNDKYNELFGLAEVDEDTGEVVTTAEDTVKN